jgi:hypothetical protein
VEVAVRVRPLLAHEAEQRGASSVVSCWPEERAVEVRGAEPRHQVRCVFDHVLGPDASQADVFGVASGLLDSLLLDGVSRWR